MSTVGERGNIVSGVAAAHRCTARICTSVSAWYLGTNHMAPWALAT